MHPVISYFRDDSRKQQKNLTLKFKMSILEHLFKYR